MSDYTRLLVVKKRKVQEGRISENRVFLNVTFAIWMPLICIPDNYISDIKVPNSKCK